jgi:hypothetical protein
MSRGAVDLDKLRVALRRMSRGNLLMVAERAIEIVPRAKLGALVGDMVRLDQLAEGKRGAAPLLDEVRKFHEASLRGEYYDSFGVNSKNFMDKSEGHRGVYRRVRTAGRQVRLRRREGAAASGARGFRVVLRAASPHRRGSRQRRLLRRRAGLVAGRRGLAAALPAYFRCLADGSSSEEFAREVDRAISDFADYERPRHLAAARRVGNAEQKAALRRLPARERHR